MQVNLIHQENKNNQLPILFFATSHNIDNFQPVLTNTRFGASVST